MEHLPIQNTGLGPSGSYCQSLLPQSCAEAVSTTLSRSEADLLWLIASKLAAGIRWLIVGSEKALPVTVFHFCIRGWHQERCELRRILYQADFDLCVERCCGSETRDAEFDDAFGGFTVTVWVDVDLHLFVGVAIAE